MKLLLTIKNNSIRVAVYWFFCLCLNIAIANAAQVSDNSSQKAEFKSDLAECSQQKKENICTYSGQAYFAQGDTKLWAPTITVYRDATNKIVKIIAKGDDDGNQGHYHSAPSQSEPLDAQADVIRLYPPKNLMVLEGHAQVTRKHDKMSGSYIEYDTSKQTVFTKPAASERTTIILYPKKESNQQ